VSRGHKKSNETKLACILDLRVYQNRRSIHAGTQVGRSVNPKGKEVIVTEDVALVEKFVRILQKEDT